MNTPTITELSITEYLNFVLEKSEGASKTDKFSDGKATMREVLEELICDLKHPTFNRRLGRFWREISGSLKDLRMLFMRSSLRIR